MSVRFTPRALRQFSSIAEFIAKDDASAARRVGERIRSVCGLLADVPGMGRAGVLTGTREMSIPGLPYVIVHRVTADEIIILGIYHHRQLRPGQAQP